MRSGPIQNCKKTGAANRIRTCDPVITNDAPNDVRRTFRAAIVLENV